MSIIARFLTTGDGSVLKVRQGPRRLRLLVPRLFLDQADNFFIRLNRGTSRRGVALRRHELMNTFIHRCDDLEVPVRHPLQNRIVPCIYPTGRASTARHPLRLPLLLSHEALLGLVQCELQRVAAARRPRVQRPLEHGA